MILYPAQYQPGMPPATRKSKNSGQVQAAPPAPQDVAPVGRSRRQAAPTTKPIPPALTTAQTASSGDQARGFAGHPNTATQPHRTANTRTDSQPGGLGTAALFTGQSSHNIGPTPQTALPPPIPARRAADRLAGRLMQETAMASPAPQLHNRVHDGSDLGNSSDSDDTPVLPHQPLATAELSLNSDDEEDSESPAVAPGRQRRRRVAKPTGTADANGYTWFNANDLVQEDNAAYARKKFT
ncbi:hypothetical protein B0H13DRAFT_1922861 [Mycena leptocephala]|nr:hypothetical protein B0H13DRAFT_1922861 [Mycena leptocephala]